MSSSIFNDPIHGSIELESPLVEIIDTPEFQRLRRIKQLGGGHLVYPGAVHTRFAHSIGVCHIAGEMITALKKKKFGLQITNEDVMSVKVAALCHDLGHGPFSHVYDTLVKEEQQDGKRKKNNLRTHEYRSCELFSMIYERLSANSKDQINDELVRNLIVYSEEVKTAADARAKWDKGKMGVSIEKCFLFEIVANGISGIDVDKMDYFERDSHGLGLSSRFNWRRYIQNAKIMKVKSEEKNQYPLPYRICSRDKVIHYINLTYEATLYKEVGNLYELFHMREQLHRTAYKHKTVIAAEMMIKKILKFGDKFIKFKGRRIKKFKITECWKDMEAFRQLDDSIIDVLWSKVSIVKDKKLFKLLEHFRSRKIIYSHIETFTERYMNSRPDTKDDEKLKKKLISKKSGQSICSVDKIHIHEAVFNYGKREHDPLDYHYFYGKNDKKGWLLKDKKPMMIPEKFQEKVKFAYYEHGIHDDDDDDERQKQEEQEFKHVRKRCRYH